MTTPLHEALIRRIALSGPISFADYMAEALGHPAHGYYMTRDPLGASGDFTTSPEISQVFGELCGLWLADMWLKLGAPSPVHLIELGPGRGTLMADILRATARVPGFAAAVRVHFVEMSPVLRKAQAEKVPNATWHAGLDEVPDGPTLLIANEFFDALPVHVFDRRGGKWVERYVDVADGRLSPAHGPATAAAALIPEGIGGDTIETSPACVSVAAAIGARLKAHPGAALLVDYGHVATAAGETMQAMKDHAFTGLLDTPGEADITAHVDFESLGRTLGQTGAKVWPALTQADFLTGLGALPRTEALCAARPDRAKSLRDATSRLIDVSTPTAMGTLFKVLAATSENAPSPALFD